MKALLDGDLVVSTMSGTTPPGTVDLPDALIAVPPARLRYVDGAFVDVTERTSFFIDPQGRKHAVQTDAAWPEVECAWNTVLAGEGATWAVFNPVPRSVTPLQMRKALRAQDLKTAIDAYLAEQDEETNEAWEYATAIDRSNAMITAAATALGKTEAEIDDLFRLAASLL